MALVSCQSIPEPAAQPTLPTADRAPSIITTATLPGNPPTAETAAYQPTPATAQTQSSSPIPSPSPSLQALNVDPTPEPTSRPAARTGYTLNARFDYAQHILAVDEQIDYPNSTGEALSELLLVIEPASQEGIFRLSSLDWTAGQPVEGYALAGRRLTIPLAQPLAPGQDVSLFLTYELRLPVIPADSDLYRPVVFGYSERQTNLVDWYPYLPPYRAGQGWLVHDPYYFGEHQVYDVSNYQVQVELVDAPPGMVLAASAIPEREGDTIYRYDLQAARSFALSASPEYLVATTAYGGVTITSYTFPWDKAAGEAALQDTAAALGLYSSLFGAYPHASLSVVEADFLDGMEYDGLYFLSRGFYNLYDGTPKGYLTAIAVHETAHQWWYGIVGNDQALEPWLDEALSTYCEYLFYQNVYPDLEDWWWGYRVDYYQPSGWIDQPISAFKGFTPYRNAVYLNGARFLRALRQQIGDDDFFAYLRDYAALYNHKLATTDDFLALLATHTQTDLSSLLQTYFDPSGTHSIKPSP